MITQEQRELRRKTVGSSDSPAIIGVDPWRNAADVYYSKINPTDDFANEAMQVGNRMEPAILDFAEDEYGKVRRNLSLTDANGILSANLDGFAARESVQIGKTWYNGTVIEAKYVGPRAADYWGQAGSDEIPEHVQIQVQHQMYVAGAAAAAIPAAIVRPQGLSFEMFHIARDQELIDSLVEAVSTFWRSYVLAKVPPIGLTPSLEILKRIQRQPKSLIDLDDEAAKLILLRDSARDDLKQIEQDVDGYTAQLLALLGEAEAGRLPDGRIVQYAEENAGRRFKLDEFREDNPAAFEEYSYPTTRRVLRIKKGPKK